MSLSARHIYRGLHREARRVAAAAGRGSEAPDFVGLVREDFKSAVAGAGADEKAREKALFKASEMLVFLRSQRKYSVSDSVAAGNLRIACHILRLCVNSETD
ncbi:hypothetical protein PYCC9005_001840 [Savitreella phatthalungensis]